MSSAAPEATTTSREFTTIGVVGLGHDGGRHRRGVRPQRLRGASASRSTTRALERGRQHLEHSTARAVKRGKLSEDEQAELLDRITFTTSLKDLAGRRPRGRGGRRVARAQEGDLPRARRRSCGPTAILATNTSSLSVTEISTANAHPGRVIGVHFFNPAPVQNFVEIIRTVVTEPEVLDDVKTLVAPARQEPGRLRRQGRLHRQHAAVRLPQPRGLDVRGPLRHPRGHRRGDALRLRLPDGPAGAARPDRPRHGVRDPRHDVQAGPRPAARADPDPQADGRPPGCSAARPAAASTPTRRPTARSSSPTTRRRRADAKPQLSATTSRVGVVGTGTMATRHRRGLRQERATT